MYLRNDKNNAILRKDQQKFPQGVDKNDVSIISMWYLGHSLYWFSSDENCCTIQVDSKFKSELYFCS